MNECTVMRSRWVAAFATMCWLALSGFGDAEVEQGKAFTATKVVDAWSGARSFVQLWNPAGSGKWVYVDRIHISHSFSSNSGCDLRIYNNTFGTLHGTGINKLTGAAASSAQLWWGNTYPSQIGGVINYECWLGARFDDHEYVFEPPIVLTEGHGLLLATAHDGVYFIVSFQFREKPPPGP